MIAPKRARNRLVIASSALLLLASVSTEVRRAAPAEASNPPGPPDPVLSEWTPTTQVYKHDDGTFASTRWAAPAHVEDSASETGWSLNDADLDAYEGAITTDDTPVLLKFSDGV